MLKPSRTGVVSLAAGGLIVLAALAAYANSFAGPFIFDDIWSIVRNPTLHRLGSALVPPADEGVGGRPLLNLTFALNYAAGGWQVGGYHAVNLAIHALAGCVLFGVVRRTLLRPPLRDRFAADAPPLALAVALLWTVHPVQTESVTYLSQRAESLMGLFYLLTLYGFIRSLESSRPTRWLLLAVAACLLGALSKEIIATAPILVLLYDRTFAAGSVREAWRRRWGFYLALGSSWLLLARLLAGLHRRGVGFGAGVSVANYALTSCRSVALYLKLAVWPHPLVIDYGNHLATRAAEALPAALALAIVGAAWVIAARRRPAVGFAGAWFFLILAPTSTFIPVPGQPTAEHRLYLSLAAVLALAVLGLYAWIGRRSLIVWAAAAVGLGTLTALRNRAYRTDLAIWTDTVAKCPENERAVNALGNALLGIPGRQADAAAEFAAALRIKPDYAEAHYNLGDALAKLPGRSAEAIAEFTAAVRDKPDYAEAHDNLANMLAAAPGRLPEALAEYDAALRINPDYAEAHNNRGAALVRLPGRLPEALAEYDAALRLRPDYPEAWFNRGMALARQPGRSVEAVAAYESALRFRPDYADAENNLGILLAGLPGRLPEAIRHWESAVRIRPDFVEAHFNLGEALSDVPGRRAEAMAEFATVLRLRPDISQARVMWERLREGR